MASKNDSVSGWTGWVAFASVILVVLGFFHVFAGVVALFSNDILVLGPENTWLVDLTSWGWAHIVWGLLGIWAGLSLAKGKTFGRVFAIVVAITSAIVNMAFIPVYPIWSILIIAMDVLVIYAVTVHGKEMKSLE